MLDYDLAEIYGYEVKRLNEQVKRNIDRFPEDFLFKLNSQEMDELSKSQTATSIQRPGIRGGRTHNIYAFTEQGIYMLATVLKGELAIQQSIYIMRTFKNMKDYLQENKVLITSEESKMIHHHEKDISSLKLHHTQLVT